MRNHRLPALALLVTLAATTAGCSGGTDGGSAGSTTSSAADSATALPTDAGAATAPETPSTTESTSAEADISVTTGGPGGAPSTPAKGLTTPQKVYAYEPNGASKNPWTDNGAAAGIVTSPEQVPAIVKSLPAAAQAEATKTFTSAATSNPPSAAHPWFVFDGTGCSFALRADIVGGELTPVMDPPKKEQPQCLAPEWRMAVYQYDAGQVTKPVPAFTAPKA